MTSLEEAWEALAPATRFKCNAMSVLDRMIRAKHRQKNGWLEVGHYSTAEYDACLRDLSILYAVQDAIWRLEEERA